MTRALITGAEGQLGRDLMVAAWPAETEVVGFDRGGLDITNAATVEDVLDGTKPDVIINAAAYTKVDQAELEPEIAEAVNVAGVAHLATWARRAGARLVHVSTDYVFDGTKDGWYVENDPIAPLGVYGASKARGEEQARTVDRHLVLRTAWVYAAHGHNFVHTMRRLAKDRTELSVVADQVGCPSSTPDLAAAIVALVGADPSAEVSGTYHLASPTAASWHEFACAILEKEIDDGLKIWPISTAEYPTPAARPANSRLASDALADVTGIRLRPWRDALAEVLGALDRPSDGGTS